MTVKIEHVLNNIIAQLCFVIQRVGHIVGRYIGIPGATVNLF